MARVHEPRPASMGPQLDSCGRPEPAAGGPPEIKLQWGRNLIVAEGPVAAARRCRRAASMGPQLDSCGRKAPTGVGTAASMGFNGAAT